MICLLGTAFLLRVVKGLANAFHWVQKNSSPVVNNEHNGKGASEA